MEITTTLQAWGNSSGVRLPKKVIKQAKLLPGQSFKVGLKGDSILLTPVRSGDTITLEEMLKGATPEKVAGQFDWGEDMGAERVY